MKEKQSTLKDHSYSPRRSGNTTRQIDKAIQLLFNDKIVLVQDHYNSGQDIRINELVFDLILKRLQSEHQLDEMVKKKMIRIDRSKLELELL